MRSAIPIRSERSVCAQISSTTHSVIGLISPVRSASGMNAAGGTIGAPGGVQRISASTPIGLPVLSWTIG